MPQYVAFRTDKDHREYILTELNQNRLRQGWGYLPEQDLRKIANSRADNQPLTEHERRAWGNRRMLESEYNGLQIGDVLLCPHLPQYGLWILARVTGPYKFDDGDLDSGDYRHCLPVEPMRGLDGELAGINPRNAHVDARLRQTMKNMQRLWAIDYLAEPIERLRKAIVAGVDLSVAHTRDERHQSFFTAVRESVISTVWDQLQRTVQGAELEHLLVPVLQVAFDAGPSEVEAVGGRGEKGADLVIIARGPQGLRYRTAVQVKMHDGITYDDHCVEQLRRAHLERGAHAGVLLTTAETLSPELDTKLSKLAQELEIDIQAWTREDFVRLLLGYLFDARPRD